MYLDFTKDGLQEDGRQIFDANGDRITPSDVAAVDLATGRVQRLVRLIGAPCVDAVTKEPMTFGEVYPAPLCVVDASGEILTAGGSPPLQVFGMERSGRWKAVRDRFLSENEFCAACGCREKKFLNVHHIYPAHLFPERELDVSNLMTLCEKPARSCHLWAHAYSWRAYNQHAKVDAALLFQRVRERLGYPWSES
jgi:hypothetical protein